MRRFAGAGRFVFNKALAWQKERYAAENTTKFSYAVLANLLPIWKSEKETEWLKESPSQSLQQSLKDLERAYINFFAKRASGSTLRARKGHHAGGMSSSFTLRENLKESDAAAQDIREAALETIYQFDWFGYAEQGKPCDEETERMVAEHEAGKFEV